ncbi:MAG: TetR/AcrR family transcriptional regulator [Gammaproteobacteria bacterium]|nr:TetR/AcrR family transcriptional regulator [Gammaproteobacteria bacterium]
MSVRERQKQGRRKAMVEAAAALFAEHGYQKTTMEMIAVRAGFGVATLYKYFQSKENIVRALTVPDLERLFADNERIIQDPPADAADALVAVLRNFMSWCDSWRDRRLLRLISVPGIPEYQGTLSDVVDWSDAKATEQIRDLLRVLQLRGQIPAGVNIADMATVVFAVFNHEYLLYVTHDDIPTARVFADIERMVRTLFGPWRTHYASAEPKAAGLAQPARNRAGRRRPLTKIV